MVPRPWVSLLREGGRSQLGRRTVAESYWPPRESLERGPPKQTLPIAPLMETSAPPAGSARERDRARARENDRAPRRGVRATALRPRDATRRGTARHRYGTARERPA